VFSNAFPAYSDPVNPTGSKPPLKKVRQLRGIEREAQEAVQRIRIHAKKHKLKRVKVSMRFKEPLILDKMSRPENSDAIS